MATPVPYREEARLVIGLLASDYQALKSAADAVTECFGQPDIGMQAIRFESTKYYLDELGPSPLRAFLSFPGQYKTDRLAEAKLTSNRLELEVAARLSSEWPRPVNIDPGYLTKAKLVLASAKNYAHRIHLADGIFAEITLQYIAGRFQPLPWTFPDYASGRYFPFFLAVRERL